MNKQNWSEAIGCLGEKVLEQHLEKKVTMKSYQSNNSFIEGGNSMNPKTGQKKWVITILIAAVLIAAAVAVAIFAGAGPDAPVVETPVDRP